MSDFKLALSFDDVLIVPDKFCKIESRLDVNTATKVGKLKLDVPLITSPMDTVTEEDMAIKIGKLGGLGILHRFASVDERLRMILAVDQYNLDNKSNVPLAFAIGVNAEKELSFLSELNSLMDSMEDKATVCIDVANGYSSQMEEIVKAIRKTYPNINIIAGNVAERNGYEFLADLGVDAVRVGIGGGSICKTRIQTGIGVPTLESVFDVNIARIARMILGRPAPEIIADGGIKYPADLCKSLAAGASAIIAGGIFAGTTETPGEIIEIDGEKYKSYRGAASAEIQNDKRGGLKKGTVAEGVATKVSTKGSVEYVVNEFVGSLRSSMTYLNATSLDDYISKATFVRISENGLNESHAYGTKKR